MNLLGKILTLLIMVMSLLFLFVAFMVAASHQNWKGQAEENQQLADQYLENQKAGLAEAQRLTKIIEQEKVSRTLVLAQLEAQWQAAKRNYEAKNAELLRAFADLRIKTESLKIAEERLNEQDADIANLNGQVKTYIENVAEEHGKVISLQNQVFEKRGQVEALERQKEKLAHSFAMATKVLKNSGLTIYSATDPIPPVLNGIVKEAGREFITISLGSDDGIKIEHTIDIWRAGNFVGSANVVRVRNNEAVARLIPAMLKSAIRANDLVTTEWSRPIVSNN